ncbi:MAG: hypothetical protein J6Y74_03135 [Clostridia bacterium]|nr:hypothetical protein [Clostridia bacterium]
MKQRVAVILILVLICSLLFAMIACGDPQKPVAPTTNSSVIPAGKDTSAESDEQGEEQAQEQNNEQEQGGEDGEAEEEAAPIVTSLEALLSTYPTESKAFGDILAKTILRTYGFSEPIFCGYTFSAENSDATLSELTVSVAIKTDETEREYKTYKITFDPIKLDDIANGSYSITNSKSAFTDEQTYNAEVKQNDTEYLSNLYGQDDFSYVAYQNESFPLLTLQELITNYGDTINTNLSTHYEKVLKQAFRNAYGGGRYEVTSYQWDLGNADEGEVQNTKLTFTTYDNSTHNTTLRTYNVNFDNPLKISDLKSSTKVSAATANYSQAYSFSYDSSIQGTRGELINAILDKAITDNFDYQNADIIFKELSSATDADLGTTRNFTVVVKNDSGIREATLTIKTANNDQDLITNIQNGKFKLNNSQKSINYSQYQLGEYRLGESAEISQ